MMAVRIAAVTSETIYLVEPIRSAAVENPTGPFTVESMGSETMLRLAKVGAHPNRGNVAAVRISMVSCELGPFEFARSRLDLPGSSECQCRKHEWPDRSGRQSKCGRPGPRSVCLSFGAWWRIRTARPSSMVDGSGN